MFRWFTFALLLLTACQTAPEQTSPNGALADAIVDSAISAVGGSRFNDVSIAFDFRDNHFTATRRGGRYVYTRRQKDDGGNVIIDRLNNEGFTRTVNGREITLPDSLSQAFAQSVNSVHYFVQLPARLNDPAVRKTLIDTVDIKGQRYYKVQVTFEADRGGEDFRDVYLYWFNTENYAMDYLAYTFETGDGGMRFREAINRRQISGITFQDYVNLKPIKPFDQFLAIDSLYQAGGLAKVSQIENKNIQVSAPVSDK